MANEPERIWGEDSADPYYYFTLLGRQVLAEAREREGRDG